MSLFADTIHDARRPIAGGWVRRAAEEAAPEPEPMEEALPPESSGMQTVFRFQKAGQFLPREASIQPGAGLSRPPAGDPLSAGAEAERPKSPATNDGETLVSVLGVSRESELETGQVIHGSPGKVAAANVVSESKTHQSVVLPGPIETEWNRETHRSEIPEGGERLVSRQSETFLSRPTGRGAPSETYLATPTARLGAAPQPGQAAVFAPESATGFTSEFASEFASEPAVPQSSERDSRATIATIESRPAQEFTAREPLSDARASAAAPFSRPGRAPEPAQPRLVIGRIDVVVVADAAPPQPQPTARADRGFLSRNYLKRL